MGMVVSSVERGKVEFFAQPSHGVLSSTTVIPNFHDASAKRSHLSTLDMPPHASYLPLGCAETPE